jgi:hypothetical protein
MINSKVIAVALASMAGTTAFILACGKGPGTAGAQSCAAWEISEFYYPSPSNCPTEPDYPASCRIAAGWEPFGVNAGAPSVLLRRCAP